MPNRRRMHARWRPTLVRRKMRRHRPDSALCIRQVLLYAQSWASQLIYAVLRPTFRGVSNDPSFRTVRRVAVQHSEASLPRSSTYTGRKKVLIKLLWRRTTHGLYRDFRTSLGPRSRLHSIWEWRQKGWRLTRSSPQGVLGDDVPNRDLWELLDYVVRRYEDIECVSCMSLLTTAATVASGISPSTRTWRPCTLLKLARYVACAR